MINFRRNYQNNEPEENHYYLSISDLMTSILLIFILILAYVMLTFQIRTKDAENQIRIAKIKINAAEIKINKAEIKTKEAEIKVISLKKREIRLSKKTKQIKQNIENRKNLLEEIKKDLQSKDINITINTNTGNLRLKSDLLFKRGSADISDKGKNQIDEISKIINRKMKEQKYKSSIDTIFIEGHTDTVPIHSKQFKSNKELSAQRAINTFSEMISSTKNSISSLKNKEGRHLLSYSGYSSTRPRCIEKEAKKEDLAICRAENRRIEFYFTVNTPNMTKNKENINE